MDRFFKENGVDITIGKKGALRYTKTSYPVRYGFYHQIETQEAIYQFNLDGEIIYARYKNGDWPDPQEWLKRSMGNDWIYYSTGGYSGVFEAVGEYYLPNLPYATNSLLGGAPFSISPVVTLLEHWHKEVMEALSTCRDQVPEIARLKAQIQKATPCYLAEKAEKLFAVNGGRVTVLPPDARHVDYNVIPVAISEGCLYKCRFCRVKSANGFREKTPQEIEETLRGLHDLYGENRKNYNAVFFGEHDALLSSPGHLLTSMERSLQVLDLRLSCMHGVYFFLFGSVDGLLGKDDAFFSSLRKLGVSVFINIGLESADQQTLDRLGKPLAATKVREAFFRIQEINDSFPDIEVTANFVMDESLPDGHYPRFLELVRDSQMRKKPKGTIYLSPIRFGNPSRELVYEFNRLKLLSRLPTFLYSIQRL